MTRRPLKNPIAKTMVGTIVICLLLNANLCKIKIELNATRCKAQGARQKNREPWLPKVKSSSNRILFFLSCSRQSVCSINAFMKCHRITTFYHSNVSNVSNVPITHRLKEVGAWILNINLVGLAMSADFRPFMFVVMVSSDLNNNKPNQKPKPDKVSFRN